MQIRLLVLDVDGVLTDGRLWYGKGGEPRRAFHIQDGVGIKTFQRAGGMVAILTGKNSRSVARRARELGIPHVFQGSRDKGVDFQRLLKDVGVKAGVVAAMGDDLPDLPMLKACGYPLAPANAVAEVKAAAKFVTGAAGGYGAVREVIEHLLKREGLWQGAVDYYASGQQ